jgi:type IV fimbrial biogenesis protein FimT
MRHRGLSIIELLVALAVTAVLAGYALFWSSDWVSEKDADARVRSFATAINLARQTAIMGNVPVTLCPIDDSGCGRRNAWHSGGIIFVDFNRNRRIDGNDYEVKRLPRLKPGTRVYWRSFRNRSYLRFTARGLTDWQNGHFLFCPDDGNAAHARMLVLNAAGRMYFSIDRDGDGVHEDARGRAIACP